MIKELRKKKGLKQQEVANKVGLTQSGFSRIESGKWNPSFDLFKKIIEAMGYNIRIESN